jgi:hypothetical protein
VARSLWPSAVWGGTVADPAVAADEALDAVEIFADGAATWNAYAAALEGGAQGGEEFLLERGGEVAELDSASVELRGEAVAEFCADLLRAEFLGEEIAQADPRRRCNRYRRGGRERCAGGAVRVGRGWRGDRGRGPLW